MMITRIILTCFLSGLVVRQSNARQSKAIEMLERLTQCSREAIQRCSDKYRLCEISKDEREKCAHCELGYIDFRDLEENIPKTTSSCVEIAELSWQNFVTVYEPFYRFGGVENPTQRLTVLKESAQLISESNALHRNATYTLGITPFSADTKVEYRQRSGYFYVNLSGTSDELPAFDPPTVAAADISRNIDWVVAGAVTSVKNQGRCGCSWAMGVCGAIEGAAYLELEESVRSMSFQQLISCNKRNLGCNGGSMEIGAKYAAENWFGGVTTLNDYPFTDAKGNTSNVCNLNAETPPPAIKVNDPMIVAGLDSTMSFDRRLETFKLGLMNKPISVILKSSCKLFSNYVSGILTDDGDCACSDSNCYDHSVLMVGYDDTGEIPYFKLKNSWGTRWGEGGYFRVSQREKGEFGLFGMLGQGIMIDVQQNTDADTVELVEDNLFPIWAIVTIAILSSLCCFCFTYVGCVCWGRNRRDSYYST